MGNADSFEEVKEQFEAKISEAEEARKAAEEKAKD